MRYLPDGGQMKMADSYTIETQGISSLELMERAAASCVSALYQYAGDMKHICVVCGSGNNGGDGYAIGRMLIEAGYPVTAVMAGNPEHMTEETAYQKKRYEAVGGICSDRLREEEYSVIIDALFGVGLSREVTGRYAELIEEMNQRQAFKLAVDIPSGICADTGNALGVAFQADYTVTFQAEKLGIALSPGREYAGKILIPDIGISRETFEKKKEVACEPETQEYQRMLPERKADSNKGTYGKVLLIAGSRGMSGAAYFNALGAYRMGAGLVRIYTPEENRSILQDQLPEAVITPYGQRDRKDVNVKDLLRWADVVCIGSGIGTEKTAYKLLKTVLTYVEVPCVIDADGLNLLAENPKLERLLRGKEILLTPHMKEFARLSGMDVMEVRKNRESVLRRYVDGMTGVDCTCILKDSRSLIYQKGERLCVNTSGCAAMAKAGAGDVLAGIVTALLAQGLSTYEAAVLGAYLHGRAGEYAADKMGTYSILAREIADALGPIIKEWGDKRDDQKV